MLMYYLEILHCDRGATQDIQDLLVSVLEVSECLELAGAYSRLKLLKDDVDVSGLAEKNSHFLQTAESREYGCWMDQGYPAPACCHYGTSQPPSNVPARATLPQLQWCDSVQYQCPNLAH